MVIQYHISHIYRYKFEYLNTSYKVYTKNHEVYLSQHRVKLDPIKNKVSITTNYSTISIDRLFG